MKYNKKTEKIILQAALELFVRKGYHGTSIDAIMNKVNLTKGALYAHFTGKRELLFKIIEQYKTQFVDQMIQATTQYPGNSVKKLNYALSFNSRFAQKNPDLCVFLSFLTTELNSDIDFQYALKKVYREYMKFISNLIAQGIRQGVIKKEFDPDLAALTFMAIHDGTLHQWVLNRDHLDGKEYVKTFRSIFMNGLTK